MASETTTAITAVKQDVRLREWAEQLEAAGKRTDCSATASSKSFSSSDERTQSFY